MSSAGDTKRIHALAEVRTWLGTPWVHQGRRKGKGCDCIGLAVAAAYALGAVTPEMEHDLPRGYKRIPHNNAFLVFMRKHFDQVDLANAKVMDLVLTHGVKFPTHILVIGNYMHTGVGAPLSIIHAMIQSGPTGKVSESRWDPHIVRGVQGIYRFRGVD